MSLAPTHWNVVSQLGKVSGATLVLDRHLVSALQPETDRQFKFRSDRSRSRSSQQTADSLGSGLKLEF